MLETASEMQKPVRCTFMVRLGLARPEHFIGLMGWFEITAFAYLSYTLLMGLVVAWNRESLLLLGTATLTALVLSVLVLLAARRGSLVAYWLCFALMMGPTTKLARKIAGSPLETIASQPGAIWFPIICSLIAACLLLHPRNRLWAVLRRMELKQAKSPRQIAEYSLYQVVTEDGEWRTTNLVIEPERIVFNELWAQLPENAEGREYTGEYLLIVAYGDMVPLIMALRKTAKMQAMPKGDMHTVLRESAETALKPQSPDLKDLCQLLVIIAAFHGRRLPVFPNILNTSV